MSEEATRAWVSVVTVQEEGGWASVLASSLT